MKRNDNGVRGPGHWCEISFGSRGREVVEGGSWGCGLKSWALSGSGLQDRFCAASIPDNSFTWIVKELEQEKR